MPTLQERIIIAISKKAPGAVCPLCKVSNWAVQPSIFYHHEEFSSGSTTAISARSLPTAALVCQNCGNTHFISLTVLDPTLVRSR
jgi:hypothetical protein